jgi:hypothetical protein
MINIQEPGNLKTYAHIVDGKVVNVSVWASEPEEKTLVEIPEGTIAGIDWDYIDGEFADNRPVKEMMPAEVKEEN